MPRSLRRASKRPRQPNPRRARQPRVLQRRLKQPVRLRLRNLPQGRQRPPVGQPNLLPRPRLLRKPWLSFFAKSSPEIFREKTFAVQMRVERQNPNDELMTKLKWRKRGSLVYRASSFPKTPLASPTTRHSVYRNEAKDR